MFVPVEDCATVTVPDEGVAAGCRLDDRRVVFRMIEALRVIVPVVTVPVVIVSVERDDRGTDEETGQNTREHTRILAGVGEESRVFCSIEEKGHKKRVFNGIRG